MEGHQQEAHVLFAVAIPAAQIKSLAGESAGLGLRTRWEGNCARVRCEPVRLMDSLELEVTPQPETGRSRRHFEHLAGGGVQFGSGRSAVDPSQPPTATAIDSGPQASEKTLA